MAQRRCPGAWERHAPRDWGTARIGDYTSYKVANMLVEFSTSIPRPPLRPGYGDGFLGAPLQGRPALGNPAPREQGGPRGSSTTPSQPHPGGAPHVCAEPGACGLWGAGV